MFYSHEILSNSQYGVATIWLVATVGRGSQKRLNRKTIQEVNVPKACEKILDPGAPLALRLQGSLLYGVSRVFARQCGYVLSDAEKTQSDMMTFFRVMQTSELDPQAGKTKRHHITLQDDPSFDPMSTLPNLDLLGSNKELVFRPSQASSNGLSQMTPLDAFSQGSSSGRRPAFVGFDLELPQSSQSAGSYRLPSDFGPRSSSLPKPADEPDIMGEFRPFGEDDLEPFNGINLDFDADGNLVGIVEQDEPELPLLPGQAPAQAQPPPAQAPEEWQRPAPSGEGDPLVFGEDALPDAEAFSAPPAATQPTASHPQSPKATETEQAAAQNKKGRRRKLQVMLDQNDRVSRQEFRSWNDNYADNMEASRKRLKTTTQAQAKKNAVAFLYGNGIARVGLSFALVGVAHPLAEHFSGVPFKDRLQGMLPDEVEDDQESRGRRRKSSEAFDDEEDEAQRRVKHRDDDAIEFGRGDHDARGELVLGDETAPEIGMEGVGAMEERHSSYMMPWSRPGSAAPGSSVRGPGSAKKNMPAPSPLHGRGNVLNPFERHSDPAGPVPGSDDFGQLHSHNSSLDMGGPVGGFDFGDMGDTQESGAGLDIASQEFLGYAMGYAREKGRARHDGPEGRRWIEFEELANPATHTKAVAAQAFLHVLSLATKNVVSVEQDGERQGVPFGTIRVGIDMVEAGGEGSEDELA